MTSAVDAIAVRQGRRPMLATLPVAALVLAPIAAGLVWTALPALGYLPVLGTDSGGLAHWAGVLAYPGIPRAIGLSLFTGLAATALSLAVAVLLCATGHGRPGLRRAEAWLAPILAAPHAAIAIGFAFVIAPSGWLVRLVSPWLTGWTTPPDVGTVGDAYGLGLVVALSIKEIPFLLLMILAALGQVRPADHLKAAQALGYGPGLAWIKVILPRVYAQIRLPVMAVLVFSVSVVDMAMIVGPDTPPTLGVLAFRWLTAPDLNSFLPGAAAALLLLAVALLAILLWRVGEYAASTLGNAWVARGGRSRGAETILNAASVVALATVVLMVLTLAAIAIWSFATSWRFPDALPAGWTLATWDRQASSLLRPATMTLALAATATSVGLILVIAWLEGTDAPDTGRQARGTMLLYAPLLVPQIAFLFGLQVLLVGVGIDGTFLAVAWTHLLFVVPYTFLSLVDPWRALDPRFARSAAALGASRARILVTLKLPMLIRPLLTAVAVGFSVSVAQYLPTIFAGGGRIPTLTTESVAIATGGDRRTVAVYAFTQAFLPLLVFAAALALPRFLLRNRRDLQGG
jgi:putative thiamine transport system permease protein